MERLKAWKNKRAQTKRGKELSSRMTRSSSYPKSQRYYEVDTERRIKVDTTYKHFHCGPFCDSPPESGPDSSDAEDTEYYDVDTKRRCEVDPTRIITKDDWAVSLVRLPDSNAEHVFLVLEGIEDNKSMIWFADFVANDKSDLALPGIRNGKVRKVDCDSEEMAGSSSKLLFMCDKKMMKVRKSDRLLHTTWSIAKDTAQMLINNIKDQKKDPPKYNILGDSMVAASSAASSSNPTGHNCFTFARMMLNNLNDEYINVSQDTLEQWICSVPSRYLVDNKQSNNEWLSWSALPKVTAYVAVPALAVCLIIRKVLL